MKKLILLILFFTFCQIVVVNGQSFQALNKKEKIDFFQQNNNYSSFVKQKTTQFSSKTLKQVLDSVVSGKHISSPYSFEPSHTEVFQYDPNERINMMENYYFNTSTNSWQYSISDTPKRIFINNGLNDFECITYDSQLNQEYKYVYLHNSTGQLISVKFYFWDSTLNNWYFGIDLQIFYQDLVEDFRIYRTFDDIQGEFINAVKYDKNWLVDKQINTIESEWNMITNNWEEKNKQEFSYNSSNKVILQISSSWDGNNWIVNNERNYSYDSANRLIGNTISTDPNVAEYKYEYDEHNNITKIKNFFNSTQTTSYEINFYYDLIVNEDVIVIPNFNKVNLDVESDAIPQFVNVPNDDIYTDFLTFKPANKIDSAIYFNYWSNPTFEGRYYYHYSQRDLGLNSVAENRPKVYPNPATNFINIDKSSKFEFFELIDIKGEVVQKGKLDSSKIDISQLKSGIYQLNFVSFDKSIIRSKVVKE